VRRAIQLTSLLLSLLFIQQTIAAEDLGMAMYRQVIAVGRECAKGKSGSQVVSCYVRASPKKCEAYVYPALAQYADERLTAQHAWAYCVSSCLDASAWSRNFGECSRELK
jgi:hypothetical protein